MTTFIFHGIEGHPGENWFPWLKAELETRDERVIVPAFPDPSEPRLHAWLDHMNRYAAELSESTLIGHSLGAAFALRLIENRDAAVRRCVLVAPVWGVMGNAFDDRMRSFTEAPYDWAAIRSRCPSFRIFQSDDDPYIKKSLSERLADNLGAEMTLIPRAGHFNTAAGYTTFPNLLEFLTG